jgi:transcriptional regulator GlxA family with amidase domain
MDSSEARRVVIAIYPGLQPLDVVGPAEVFATADAVSGGSAYAVEVVASEAHPIAARSGAYAIAPQATIARCRGPIDTLLVVGAFGLASADTDEKLVSWVRRAAGRSRRVASVCTGAFLLAQAGLLDGRRVTTHWSACEELARRYPEVEVDPNPIFVRDGNLWTSAGVTAGMDLALAMVEEDLGHEVSLQVARILVLFLQRPGGQAQFSSHLSAQRARREPLRELQDWMADNLDGDLRVDALAERVNMSPRNFARFFRRETGLTPAAYVEALRVERARQWLEHGKEPIEQVARKCGFGTPETMRRSFDRRVGVAPADYRARFRRAANGDRAALAAKEA